MPSLTRTEAATRAALLTVESYEVDLDLTGGADTFASSTTIRFAAHPGGATFVEVRPVRLRGARLNGVELDVRTLADGRLPLDDLAATNELVVDAEMAYSNTGEGLHRFVDPADGNVYLYAMSFLDCAQRIFACFDQPDLKAPVTLAVTAPVHWLVAGNGSVATAGSVLDGSVATAGDGSPLPGRWVFAETPPLATYVVSVLAGPYHVVRSEHDGVPLALYCRASLARELDADAEEILTVTRRCLDRFHELCGFRYPFGAYEQAFVPEFNAGAMENPGLVLLRDDYVFTSVVTEADREQRATTIAHEMAHMWFGDLVTMRWWDDLWLNESFAEYLGTRVTAEVTRFDQAWTSFAMRRKAWGYEADQRPSTHPVAPTDVSDTALALLNFDGISYAKGAAVLRQLVAWVGDEAFLSGLRSHFTAHAFGTATLADLLATLSAASGRDLSGWAEQWLRHAGVNTLRPVVQRDAAGRYAAVTVLQEAPPALPTLRQHRVGIGLYDRTDDAVVLRRRIEVDLDPAVDGGRTAVPELTGEPAADLLLLNDGDLTYAKVRLDGDSAAAVPLLLPLLADAQARALLWAATVDAVRDGERPVAELLALVSTALPAESQVVVVQDVLAMTRTLVDRRLGPDSRPAALGLLAQACDRLIATSEPGDSRQLAGARGLVRSGTDTARLRGWLTGADVPPGLVVDLDLRWRVLYRLVVLGAAGPDDIAAAGRADRSSAGEQWAARCRAALPDPVAKQQAWHTVTVDLTASNRIALANAEG
ncbi:MAG TPA: aminopeptidase N, partial [Actinoplanes sp.]|nr:aminopeptidase N [Actinoplanes sp.]